MQHLSDKALLNAYVQANELRLDPLFIRLLEKELEKRLVNLDQYSRTNIIKKAENMIKKRNIGF